MRLRYWTALLLMALIALVMARWNDPPARTPIAEDAAPPAATTQPRAAVSVVEPAPPPPDVETETWSREVGRGDSLDMLLAEAGLDVETRTKVSEVLGSEYDLRRLQPGHGLTLEIDAEGAPRLAVLEVEDGVRIEAVFGATPSVRALPPVLETVRRAGRAEIRSSIYAALEEAGIPTRFATDLELVFAGTLDLRRELGGGERLRIAWRENRQGSRTIGEPLIDFAELDLGEARYEVLWPGETSRRTRIYLDDRLVQVFDQPIAGARLSSAFGPRKHPVHGGVRMHSGVDFEADEGARVQATRSGEIVFAGRRGGYGLMVEIAHDDDIRTLYAHLSTVDEAIEAGRSVEAGDVIGRVGSSGTSTAPHLHYEVIVEGQPVAPLTADSVSKGDEGGTSSVSARPLLDRARQEFGRVLASDSAGDSDTGG